MNAPRPQLMAGIRAAICWGEELAELARKHNIQAPIIEQVHAMLYEGKLIWQGKVGEIDSSGNAHVDQFIHGRAEGPIRMQVRKL